jgi:hypothetical protein
VASWDGDRARRFAAELGLEMAVASYEDLLASDRVVAVMSRGRIRCTPSGSPGCQQTGQANDS